MEKFTVGIKLNLHRHAGFRWALQEKCLLWMFNEEAWCISHTLSWTEFEAALPAHLLTDGNGWFRGTDSKINYSHLLCSCCLKAFSRPGKQRRFGLIFNTISWTTFICNSVEKLRKITASFSKWHRSKVKILSTFLLLIAFINFVLFNSHKYHLSQQQTNTEVILVDSLCLYISALSSGVYYHKLFPTLNFTSAAYRWGTSSVPPPFTHFRGNFFALQPQFCPFSVSTAWSRLPRKLWFLPQARKVLFVTVAWKVQISLPWCSENNLSLGILMPSDRSPVVYFRQSHPKIYFLQFSLWLVHADFYWANSLCQHNTPKQI